MIPANIDHIELLNDLNRMGWRDYKIGMMCDFSPGYISNLRSGVVRRISWQYGARIYNFWLDEREQLRAKSLVLATT